MSKCELLPKGCDCGTTEAAKCQQRESIISMMQADEKDGIYQASEGLNEGLNNGISERSPLEEFFNFMESRQYFIGNDLFEKYKELTDKKPMKSREEIEQAITVMQAEIETGLDVFHEIYYQNKIEALKWVLNTQ